MILHKLGNIISETMLNDWNMSYAAVPFARKINDHVYRIYFTSRDEYNQSYGSYVDYNIQALKLINTQRPKPIISKGDLGHFDDSGVTISCFIKECNLIYYMGWNLPQKVPFSNQIGILQINSNNALTRYKKTPILGKCEYEPLSFGYPWVLSIKKNTYQMWYDTILKWNSKSLYDYKFILRSAISQDGINWKKTYSQSFYLSEKEKSIARPCVIKEDGLFKMWCAINTSDKYRLSYAESFDGNNWNRKDEHLTWAGMNETWDSDEQTYPFLIQDYSEKFILYNGNNYGKTGFGICLIQNN